MRLRELGWVIFLAGLPWSHLVFRPHLDIWHSHALWAQGWCLILFAASVGSTGVAVAPNRPLAAFVAWVGLVSLSVWVKTMVVQKQYPLPMLQGLMHLVLLVFFYQAAISTWRVEYLPRLLRTIAWTGLFVVGYCVLQLMSLDQFFMNHEVAAGKDIMVGVMGNYSHLSAHLALLLPIFLLQAGWFWRGIAALTLLLISLSGSLGGQVAALAMLTWWAWHSQRWLLWIIGALIGVGVLWILTHHHVVNPHGRFVAWQKFYELFAQRPITGFGPGFVMEFSRTITESTNPIFQWRHVHNEYFQAAIEYGVVGAGLLAWGLKELVQSIVRLPKTPLVVALVGILLAVGMNSLVNFPLHLWALGGLGLMAYCGLRVCQQEQVA